MNATGRPFWLSVAPIAKSEASRSTVKGFLSLMQCKQAELKLLRNVSKADTTLLVSGNISIPVSGAIFVEKFSIQRA